MSLNKIVFSLVFSALIVFGFNIFFLQNNIDAFVNRQVIQSTKQELAQVGVVLEQYLNEQSEAITGLSKLTILRALETREFTTDDIALIRRSTQTILESNIAIQYIRLIDVDNYQLLYSTNVEDVVAITTETIRYLPLTTIATLTEESILITASSTPSSEHGDRHLYFTHIDEVNNRLILAAPLVAANSEQRLLAIAYYAIDKLREVIPDFNDLDRSLIGIDGGIIVNPIPSIDYLQSITEPIASHSSIQLSNGTQYIALTEEISLSITLYSFIAQQQLSVNPITNLIVLVAIGSMIFVIMLFLINLSQSNEVYIKNQLSIFRKKLLYLSEESPNFRDFELLNRLTLQREALYDKIASNLKGSDEVNRKLFSSGWQRLLAALQLDGVLDESSIHAQYQEQYPDGTTQLGTPSQTSRSLETSHTSNMADNVQQSVLTISSPPPKTVPTVDTVAIDEDIASLEIMDVEQDNTAQHEKVTAPLDDAPYAKLPALHYIAPQNTASTPSPPSKAVVRTKGLLYKALTKSIRPVSERDGVMQISQLLFSHQRKEGSNIHDDELSELIDTLSV